MNTLNSNLREKSELNGQQKLSEKNNWKNHKKDMVTVLEAP